MRASLLHQLKVLLWRNFLLKRRNMKQLLQELLYPLFYTGILLAIKLGTKPKTQPPLSFPVNSLSDFPVGANTSLYVVSNGLSVNSVMGKIVAQLNSVNYQVYATERDALDAYNANGSANAAGIIFGYNNNSAMHHYAIRLPQDAVADTKSLYTTGQNQGECRNDWDVNGTSNVNCQANRYLSTGFAYLQSVINQALMEELSPGVASVKVSLQLMPKDEYTTDIATLQIISSIYYVLAYSFFVNFLTVGLVAEKEKKIREGMFMMGLRNSVFWFSWFIFYFAMILVVTSLVTLIMGLASFFTANTNMFIFWLILMLYGLSIIALSFLLTPFFKQARTAGGLASFATMLLSLIYLAVSLSRTRTATGYDYGVPPSAQWAMCILSPVALALAMDKGILLDIAQGGMNFDTMTVGEFPLYAPILMLFVDVVLYFLLAIYLDHVIPGEFGPRYKPWYFLQKSYWFSKQSRGVGNAGRNGGEEAVSGPNIEPVAAELHNKRTMRIVNISKVFSGRKETVTAVKNLSLDMYEGQITALLGHNGAGKTTLINMLTGVMPPSSGTAFIRGLDVSRSGDMEEIRSMCGICPQHNILYDELSVKEHLQIFAGIKGVPSDKVEAEVMRAMKSVDLEDQADVLASKLSGGQKRKLSVAMALIGDPKIIVLDEPTAGMDPYSRRHLWSLLKTSKEGRLILLTTHFMDEADILADRKAIVSKGQLKCCGSSLFLKSKFGIGYHLNMVVEPSCRADAVTELLSQHVGGVEFKRSHGKELAYTIPISEVTNFANLFKALETKEGSKTAAESLGILSYGVSMPTLEEVFLKLGEDEEVDDEEPIAGMENHSYHGSLNQIHPTFGDQKKDQVNITMSPRGQDPSRVLHTLPDRKGKTGQIFKAFLKFRFVGAVRSPAAWIFLIVFPIALVAGGLAFLKSASTSDTTPTPLLLSGALYARGAGSADTTLPGFFLQDSVNNAVSQDIVTQVQSVYSVDAFTSSSVNLSDVAPHFIGADLLTTDTATSNLASYTALYNDTALHSLPAVLSSMTSAVMKKVGLSQDIVTYSLPWPGERKNNFDNAAFSSTLMIGLAFALVAPGFAIGIVQEKQWNCKSLLRIAGVSFHMYWGTLFLFSLIIYLVPATSCLIIALAMEVPSLTHAGAIICVILLFILYIPQTLTVVLVLSFMFDKFETAQAVLPNLFIMGGMFFYFPVSFVDMLASEVAARVMHYIFVFINPVYTIFGGFYYIDKIHRIASYTDTKLSVGDYFKFENNIVICLISCIVDTVVMYFLLRILEVRSNGGSVHEALRFGDINVVQDIPQNNSDTINNEDEDVVQERARVEQIDQGTCRGDDAPVAYVRQIRKEFIKTGEAKKPCTKPPPEKVKVAVRNLSFAVNKGEVFGLLGPNGAGKTTALSMMTADVHPTRGKVVVAGHHVRSNMSEAFHHLGFCPQHDALWETIKLSEHLELYAAVKGIPEDEIPTVVDYFIENLKVQEHRNKYAKKLSGGTKRKLSYAMAMLGRPEVVLLDEPSTGMDPQSKRFLWDTISGSFEGQDRGAILTTHYMEEADALCSRVGIMVNGQMECLGPTQHLKMKYGSGYLLEVKLGGSSSASREELEEKVRGLEQHLLTLFPNATCLESFAERAQYKIPQSDVSVLSTVFAALEDTKESHGVEEYSFSQSTLEQVFLNFAKKQLEEGEDPKLKASTERQLSKRENPPVEETNGLSVRL